MSQAFTEPSDSQLGVFGVGVGGALGDTGQE